MTALTLLVQTANKAAQAAPFTTPARRVAAPVDPGHAAANSSHLGFGSGGLGAGEGVSGALTGGLTGAVAPAVTGALAGAMGGAGASPHPQMLSDAPHVHGESVRWGPWMGLHGAEMRAMAKGRFDRSDTAGTGHSGAAGNAPVMYTPTPGDGGGGIGGALPFTMPTMGRRDQSAPIRAPRAPRVARDITDVAAALPKMKARRATRPTGI